MTVSEFRMRDEIVPFASEHVEPAAVLLAARHRADREREPELPTRFEEPSETRPLIQQALASAGAAGVMALRGGDVTGYLVGRPRLGEPFLRARAGWIDYAGHAVGPDADGETYRAMYAALAARFLAAGCVSHYITVPATDREALRVWFSLGFGVEHTRAVRDTAPLASRTAPGIALTQAGDEDVKPVTRMAARLALYHTGSPIFLPCIEEDEAESRRQLAELLQDRDHRCLLASRDGESLAMLLLAPPVPSAVMVTPPRCVHIDEAFAEAEVRGQGVGAALLDDALTVAREDGFERCTVSWMSANLSGARFWQGNGFRPLLHRLVREVDARATWAHAAGNHREPRRHEWSDAGQPVVRSSI